MAKPAPRAGDGRFHSFRVNVEDLPRLPAYVARYVLEDPRRRPYLALWTSCTWGTGDRVALAMTAEPEGEYVRIVMHGYRGRVLVVRRPIHGGSLVTFWRCPSCARPVRYLYSLRATQSALVMDGPACSRCQRLRWSSQGRSRSPWMRGAGPLPRRPWDPAAVVSSPAVLAAQYPELAGLLGRGVTGAAPRWPTARAEETIRRQLGKMNTQIAALGKRLLVRSQCAPQRSRITSSR